MSGDLGVAVHSHWFSVGAIVSWARAGVGAVATQSVAEPGYGPGALDALERGGGGAEAALQGLLDADPLARVRQVGVVDAAGGVAVHTGADCIPCAGHVVGDGFGCQANMMAAEGVPEAMAAAFEASEGPLAERLVEALQGAEGAGGDVRGRQSAALVVVPASGDPWRQSTELRVEDHPDPITELQRLLVLSRAYDLAGEGDELLAEGKAAEAGERYRRASALAPDSDELLFWAGLAMAGAGDLDGGVAAIRRAAGVHPGWLVLLDRLTPEFAPAGAARPCGTRPRLSYAARAASGARAARGPAPPGRHRRDDRLDALRAGQPAVLVERGLRRARPGCRGPARGRRSGRAPCAARPTPTTAPNMPVLALMTATGLLRSGLCSNGRETQSSAFLSRPGIEPLYSGVANRTPSASAIAGLERRSTAGVRLSSRSSS